jgi:hypothetical protein
MRPLKPAVIFRVRRAAIGFFFVRELELRKQKKKKNLKLHSQKHNAESREAQNELQVRT